jgi:putative hydroxymethylpyrimidine transporter CytX
MRWGWLRKPEDWGIDPVPPEKRSLRTIDLAVLWFNLGVGLLVLYAGTFISSYGFGLVPLLLIVVAGSVLGSALLAGAGTIGTRHGVPTMVSLRPIFGRRGSFVPTVLNATQLFGWTALEIWVMSVAATALSGPLFGRATGVFWVLVFGVFCGLLAWGGPLLVVKEWLERVGLWLVLIGAGWITYRLASAPDLVTSVPLWGGDWTKAGLGLDLVIAMPISWWPLIADYNRFAQSTRKAFLGTTVGYVAANAWFYLLGAVMVLVLGLADDPTAVFAEAVVAVYGALALLAILADETDNGFANIYSTSVSVQNIRPRATLRRLVPIVTAAGVVAAAVLSQYPRASVPVYQSFLYFIGGVFVPMLGVVLANVYVVRRSGYRLEEFGDAPIRPSLPAFVAWGLGMLVYFSIYLVNLGTVSLNLAGLNLVGASLPAFAVSAVVYVATAKWLAPSGERAPA